MRVEIINKEELLDLYHNHGLFACTCYDTPDKYADKVGKACMSDGHTSGSRTEYIKFRIYDADRGTCEQMMRHEIGTDYNPEITYSYQDRMDMYVDVNPNNIVKNMQSFRYVDKYGFSYTTPKNIAADEKIEQLYKNLMDQINITRVAIKEMLLNNGVDEKKAIEDANFVLPRATNLTLTIGFTPEALIHFMHKRLCTRAQDEIRNVAIEMKKAVKEILPEFANQLMPHCQHLLWCPEGKNMTCGMYPRKDDVKALINASKQTDNEKENDGEQDQ